jgi:glyceraldehyde-3-phosphate dehydrogenase/erythrose-4-phosphate dehydrogenase
MKGSNIVHVVGTGTIGEPLIGLLADYRQELGIDEVTFSKRTPLLMDRSKVYSLQKRGAKLCVEREKFSAFRELEMEPTYEYEEAIENATVLIDCTPAGRENKRKFYEKYQDRVKGFLAQGSEFGFGRMYAYGINDGAIRSEDQFIHIVSCNTHNIAAIVKTFTMESNNDIENSCLNSGRFLCLRRATDISEEKGASPSPQVGRHDDQKYGTHQARDAAHLFATLGHDFNLFSSAIKLSTQYMHVIWFDLILKEKMTYDDLLSKIQNNKKVAMTHKEMASLVFSFGRDHGHYGRILNQTVIALPSLHIRNGNEVIGFSFTPQDGNSLMSSIAATVKFLDGENWESNLEHMFDECLFKEI